MDVKAAIDAGDAAALERILASDPERANAPVLWADNHEHLTHPIHYICDKVFARALTADQSVSLARALLAAGADVDFGNGDPLNAAASLGALEVAFVLLDAGARPDLLGFGGETALHWAAYIGAAGLVDRLIAAGAPLDVKDGRYSATPLGWALHGWSESPVPADQGGHREVVLRLARAGSAVEPEWLTMEQVRADPIVSAALRGERFLQRPATDLGTSAASLLEQEQDRENELA